MDRQSDSYHSTLYYTDRRMEERTDIQKYGKTERQIDIRSVGLTERHTERQIDRRIVQADRQTGGKTDRQTDIQTDIQTDRRTGTQLFCNIDIIPFVHMNTGSVVATKYIHF